MKIKNLDIKKVLKNTAIAVVTGTVILSAPIANTKVEAASYYSNYNDAMSYFTINIQEDFSETLEKTASATNLKELLEYYNKLYRFINKNSQIRGTYYKELTSYEQSFLSDLLVDWGNQIYEVYRNKTYFNTNCKNILGFTLTYDSHQVGYDYDHKETMKNYTETLDKNLENYLDASNSQSNLNNALSVYKKLINFIKGNTRSYGYIFNELTITEQQEIINLLENWTYDIQDEYENYNYYSSSCVSKIGWTVNMNNVYRELGEYIGINEDLTQNPNYPIYPNYPQYPSYPTTPSVPSTPSQNVNQNNNVATPSINNTIGKDWRANYIDPSIDTSREVKDYTPDNVDDVNNYYYKNNYNTNYSNGYYDVYGNYVPYNSYNQYNPYNPYTQYEDGYVEDYVPKYIP